MTKKLCVLLLDIYRKYLSPLKLPTCKFYPTCSEYAKDAIIKYGALKGISKSAWRLIRCNPFSRGGYDPA